MARLVRGAPLSCLAAGGQREITCVRRKGVEPRDIPRPPLEIVESRLGYIDGPHLAAFVLSMGLAASYPMDAVITAKLRRQGLCAQAESECMLAFSNNSRPSVVSMKAFCPR